MKIADPIVRAAVVVAWCGVAFGQLRSPQPSAREIALVEGRGELLRFQSDITREVVVNAKGPGHTTVIIWETGAEPVRYEVDVSKDMADWESFRKQIVESA